MCVRTRLDARTREYLLAYTVARYAIIRYDRSRLSLLQLQYPTRIVSIELTNGPPVQPGFRQVINDIISARLVDTFVFKFT